MKLAILDRIGTLNAKGENTIVSPQQWRAQEGALEAIAQLNRGGWQVTLATNQPGIGRGSSEIHELNQIHLRMQRELAAAGARIEAVFFCPHTADDACSCRMPAPGLLQQVASRYGAEPHEVWVIAQDGRHLEAGEAMGAHVVALRVEPTAAPGSLGQNVPLYDSWKALADALAPADVQQHRQDAVD